MVEPSDRTESEGRFPSWRARLATRLRPGAPGVQHRRRQEEASRGFVGT